MISMVWNFGGVYIYDAWSGNGLLFDKAIGSLWYEDEAVNYTTLTGFFNKKPPKWRGYAEINFPNLCNEDALNIGSLLQLLNLVAPVNGLAGSVLIYPRFDISELTNIGIEMQCISEIDPKNLHMNGLGQTLTLKFKAVRQVNSLPTQVSGQAEANITGIDNTEESIVTVMPFTTEVNLTGQI